MSLTDPETRRKLVSIVFPALNEAENLPALIEQVDRIREANTPYDFEVVLVDDGSTDGTAEIFIESINDFPKTCVRLSRNFGSHYAISAGIKHATGDCAVVLGADLQEPPHLVTDFIRAWEAGSDVVWGIRRTRVGRSWATELPSKLFSYLFSRYARLANYPPEGPSGVLLDRAVMDELQGLPEHNRNVLALIAWLGFHQTRVLYDQCERQRGRSGWTRAKLIKLAVDSLLQFSSMPLRACSLTGVFVAGLGMVYAVVLVARALAGVTTPSGWPTLLVTVLLLGGVQLTVIGIMGEYLWRAVEEVRGRPLYVVRDVRHRGDHVSRDKLTRQG